LILAWFQMANLEWRGGVCPAEPGLPNLLLYNLERVRVVDPPEYTYREYERRGTLRCKVMIFVGRSTLYPDVEPWFFSTTEFRFPNSFVFLTPTQRLPGKPYDACEWSIGNILDRLQWDFPTGER
jgi:hypothetical protein